MLHLIFQSPIELSILERIESGDDVIFLENAVFLINKGNYLTVKLCQMIKNNIQIYVLHEDVETRGLKAENLVSGVELIDYSGFVSLTEKNKVVQTWN